MYISVTGIVKIQKLMSTRYNINVQANANLANLNNAILELE